MLSVEKGCKVIDIDIILILFFQVRIGLGLL